jgi:hypothetical protein
MFRCYGQCKPPVRNLRSIAVLAHHGQKPALSPFRILVGLGPLPLPPAFGAAVSALLGASLHALGGVYTARQFTGAPPVESTIGQQLGAFVLLLPFALVAPPQV